jgi:hypothetical protein
MRVLRGVHENTQAMNLGVSVAGNSFYFVFNSKAFQKAIHVQGCFLRYKKLNIKKKERK